MPERLSSLSENKESIKTIPLPQALDVVCIDGRWAQAYSDDGDIIYLNDKSKYITTIIPDEYAFQPFSGYVADLVREGQITSKEYMAIHWGPEQKKDPYLRHHVTVFGKYTKKQK